MHTLDELIQEALREFKMRNTVYAKRVQAGRMTQQQADRQISLMHDIVTTLQGLALAEEPTLFPPAPAAAQRGREGRG